MSSDAQFNKEQDLDTIWASLISGDEPLWLKLPAAPLAPASETEQLASIPTAAISNSPAPTPPSAPRNPAAPAAILAPYLPLDPIFGDMYVTPAADYESGWPPAPMMPAVHSLRRRNGDATVIEVMTELNPRISEAGGLSWFQLTRAVKLVGGDEYKVGRIAEELAEAGVTIIERPRRQMAGKGAMWAADEEAKYELIARAAFASLPRRAPHWDDVALALGKLRRKVTPELRPRLIEYYNLHQMNRTDERAIFAELDALRACYPQLDPRSHEIDDATRICWRRIPQVAAIYDTICTDHMWSVARIALLYQNERMSFDDLFQEGCIGILRAIDTFALERGLRFATYAGNWAKQRMRRVVDESGNVICLPAHMMDKYYAGRKAAIGLEREIGCRPTSREIDKAAALRPGTWRRFYRILNVSSLDRCPAALQIADEETTLFDMAARATQSEAVQRMIARVCSNREQRLLRLRYGIDDGISRTLEEVSREFNITRERVRQIIDKTLARLRKAIDRAELARAAPNSEASKVKRNRRRMAESDIVSLINAALAIPRRSSSDREWGRTILRQILTSLIYLYPAPEDKPVLARLCNIDCLANAAWVAKELKLPYTQVIGIQSRFFNFIESSISGVQYSHNETASALTIIWMMLIEIRRTDRRLVRESNHA